MEEFYFLFALATLWVIFAVVQDLKTREIANWLNFSLIVFVLAYRAMYAAFSSNAQFFYVGLVGVILSVVLAYLFYYGRIFAGGDAKLLMGLGGALPYATFQSMFVYLGIFVFTLFLFGAIWTVLYSAFLIPKRKDKFFKAFEKSFIQYKFLLIGTTAIVIILVFIFMISGFTIASWFTLIFLILPFLFMYVKAVEDAIMIKKKKAKDLAVGDWLVSDVRLKGKVIKKTVHGLTPKDISMLKKARKAVYIKDGVPFTPAFLFAYLAMMIIFFTGFSVLSVAFFPVALAFRP